LRIVLILESWGSGGTEQYVRTLYTEIKQMSTDCLTHLVLLKGMVADDFLSCETWCDEVTVIDGSSKPHGGNLLSIVRNALPDICHLHLYTSTLSVVRTVGKLKLTKVISTFHSPISQWSWRHRIKLWLAVRKCDAVIGASEFTANQLRSWDSNVMTASPPVDVAKALIEERERRPVEDRSGKDFLT